MAKAKNPLIKTNKIGPLVYTKRKKAEDSFTHDVKFVKPEVKIKKKMTNCSTKKISKGSYKGKPFINIGTGKACLFLPLSKQLIQILKRKRFLYFAIEESLECAEQGYYSAGILAYSQCLNSFNQKVPKARHRVAHNFLEDRPNLEEYDNILETLKYVAEVAYVNELDKAEKSREDFHKDLVFEWQEYTRELFIEHIKKDD